MRLELAKQVHPLLKTRGVPGTHDVQLGIETIHQLLHCKGKVGVPQFDKIIDDRVPVSEWPKIKAPVDIVLFEGWCMATPPQSAAALLIPVNQLEASEDKHGVWRLWVNNALEKQYGKLFAMIDILIFLQEPRFDAIVKWRGKQERKTFKGQPLQAMNSLQLKRFVQHYERLTYVSLAKLPQLADVVFALDDSQNIIQVTYNHDAMKPMKET